MLIPLPGFDIPKDDLYYRFWSLGLGVLCTLFGIIVKLLWDIRALLRGILRALSWCSS